MTTYNMTSTPMLHVPGLVRWLQHMAPSAAHKFMRTAYPQLTLKARLNLYEGKYTVEGDRVIVQG